MVGLSDDDGSLRPLEAVVTNVAEAAVIVTGTVDRAGRLVAAEPRLLALQQAAGGDLGQPLAVPALASLARLARTLNVLVSRGAIAAEGADVVDLWVRAQPGAEGVILTIAGWDVRPANADRRMDEARERDFAALESEGEWRCDAALKLNLLAAELCELSRSDANTLPSFMEMFRLTEGPGGEMPIMAALATRQPFNRQPAELRGDPSVRVMLHGTPIFDPTGFAGYSGGYRLLDRSAPPPAEPPADDGFAKRLDSALRGPLGRIIANADEIAAREEGPLRRDYVDYATDISAAGRHLLGLVDDIADLQAADRLDFRVDIEEIDLADVARRAAGLLAVRAGDRGVRIDSPDPGEALHARGDFRRVLQILVNLIGNAIRYSPDGSPVWVRSEEEGDLAAIIVCDQGKGIAAADQERIFERFERVDPSEPGTTGLGLYISRQLARAMGGDITVDSAPGMGARFILTLPR